MAKKKRAKKVNKLNTQNDLGVLQKSIQSIMPVKERTNAGWIIINLVLIAMIFYGVYHIYYIEPLEGLSIIVFGLIIILIIKLILKLKKVKKR